jgi:hypothetical protein
MKKIFFLLLVVFGFLSSNLSAQTCTNNLLQNSGFENSLSNWDGLGEIATTGVQSGTKSLKICQSGQTVRQTRTTTAGKSYTLNGFAKKDAGTNMFVTMKFLNSSFTPLIFEYSNSAITSTWSALVPVVMTAPIGAAYVEISILHNGGTGCVYADALCFNENNTVNACNPDITAPTFINCPANILLTTAGTSAIVTWVAPTAIDVCNGQVGTNSNFASGASFPIGTNNVIYTASDNANNTSSCSFSVTVNSLTTSGCANNLLQNAGFENGDYSSWRAFVNNDPGDVIPGVFGLFSGQACSGSLTQSFGQSTPAIPGKTYTLSGYACSSYPQLPNDMISVGLLFWDANDNFITQKNYPITNCGQFTMTETAPTGTAKVISYVSAQQGCITVDNLCLVQSGGSADLELTAVASNLNPSQWSNFNVKYTLKNNGTAPASGILMKIKQPVGLVYQGGQIYSATQGTFNDFSHEWNIGSIAAGQNAVLTVNYFNTTSTSKTLFAQVTAQNEPDLDSQPNNNTTLIHSQDDEVAVAINGGNTGGNCSPDITPPTITSCPANISLISPTTIASWTAPTAADNCGTPTLSSNFQSGASFPMGTTSIIYTARDAANNTTTCTFTVTVTQVSAACPGNLINNYGFEQGTTAPYTLGGPISLEQTNPISGLYSLRVGNTNGFLIAVGIINATGLSNLTFKHLETAASNGLLSVQVLYFNNQNIQVGSDQLILTRSVGQVKTENLQLSGGNNASFATLVFNNLDMNSAMLVDDICVTGGGTTPLPNCAAQSDFPWEDWISAVKVGTIEKTSSKTPYSNFTTTVFGMKKSMANPIVLTGSWSYLTYDEYFRVWIDFNHDDIFQNTEKVYEGILTKPANGTASKALTASISIPATALNGNAKMRVVMRRGAYGEACGAVPFGEVEDYTVSITQSLQTGTARENADINQFNLENIADYTLFPNPAGESVSILFSDEVTKSQTITPTNLTFINQLGKPVYQRTIDADILENRVLQVDLSGFSNGLYLVKIETVGQRAVVKRLMVSRMY